MAKILSVKTENVGGLGDFQCQLDGESTVIRGPNASGKTKLITAIEYGLTGKINVASNSEKPTGFSLEYFPSIGTKGKKKFTNVEVALAEPGHDNFTISRNSKSPNNPTVNPDNEITRGILGNLTALPELALFRHNVLNFVTAEPESRAEWLEIVLSKSDITQERENHKFALSRSDANVTTARELLDELSDSIREYFEIPEGDEITEEEILARVIKYREKLDLAPLDAISINRNFLKGMDDKQHHLMTNRDIILFRLRRFSSILQNTTKLAKEAVNTHLFAIAELEKDSNLRLFPIVQKFVADVQSLDNEGSCPINADILENENSLLNQYSANPSYLDSQKLWNSIYANAEVLIQHIEKAVSQISKTASALGRIGEDSCCQILKDWCMDLESLKALLRDPKAIVGLKDRLRNNWLSVPAGLESQFEQLMDRVKNKPIESEVEDTFEFLNNTNRIYRQYIETKTKLVQVEKAATVAMAEFVNYCKNTDPELNVIYNEVMGHFIEYYDYIYDKSTNSEDAVALLETHEGKLDFKLEFHGEGKFPPEILHSEGDQHVIGICMYLAVLKYVSGDSIDFILMDDVLTSIDAENRGKICKMLKEFFKDTQFIFTTHDRIFANQIRHSGLVSGKNELRFYGWDIETGPKTYKVIDWQTSIKELLKIGNIEEAAHKLRYNLEGIFFYLACDLGAEVKLQSNLQFGFGNLKKGVIRRVNEIIALANTSANKRNSDREKVKSFSDRFKDCKAYSHTEEWLINDSIHFNPETVSANELREAVTAYIKLLDCLWCNKCHSWLQMYSSNSNESFQCNCKRKYLNLHNKA